MIDEDDDLGSLLFYSVRVTVTMETKDLEPFDIWTNVFMNLSLQPTEYQ